MTAAKAMIGVIEDDPALQELLVEELEAEAIKSPPGEVLKPLKNR